MKGFVILAILCIASVAFLMGMVVSLDMGESIYREDTVTVADFITTEGVPVYVTILVEKGGVINISEPKLKMKGGG